MAATAASKSWDGTTVSPPSKGHHFLHIDDFSKDQLLAMLETAAEVKKKMKAGDESYKPFAGKSLAMIFTKPSMRTRVSFETVSLLFQTSPRPRANSNLSFFEMYAL
jgi:ornithine carbamoyltransferase